MTKRLFVAVMLFALATVMVARAQNDPPILRGGNIAITAPTQLAILNLTGQSYCSMTLSGAGSATLTPIVSYNGGSTYSTFGAIGVQTSNGTYESVLKATATNFSVVVSSVTGTIGAYEVCAGTKAASVSQLTPITILPTGVQSVDVVNVPTVIPSCPAASYPCGLPTPIPASGYPTPIPFPTLAVNVQNAPTVVPSCPATSYPCGLPTPQPIFTFPPNVQPSPLYTMPVTTPAPCSTATCSTVVYPGVTPWPVTTAPPIVQPSPLYTMPVHDAAPVQPSPLYTMPVTTPAPIASCHAPSPAPANLTAIGYNANGCDGPIICTHTAQVNWTTSTTKVLVSLSAGKIIYVCSVSMSAEGTGAGAALLETGTKTTNDCDTGTTVGPAIIFGSGTSGTVSNLALGSGVGTVYRSPVSASLCAFNTGTSAIVEIQVMYEQFFHALTPDQVEEFCSVPKRCAIFGLYQKLNRIIDRATTPF